MTIIDQIEKEQLRNDLTPFNIGDTVRVSVRIKEGDKAIFIISNVFFCLGVGGMLELIKLVVYEFYVYIYKNVIIRLHLEHKHL